ncbi:MAG: glycosyltransferase family 1 protein [Dermabacter sp.]|nr:glycosyltransferase family 1 protein [Dermabacter sp.]
MNQKQRLLILSFSPIARDARVLKQVKEFAPRYEVTTCGYEAAPEGVSEHIQIPSTLVSWRLNRPLTMLRQFDRVYWSQEVVAWCLSRLTGRTFDCVLANDVEAVPLALRLTSPEKIHADLHEYSPRQKEDLRRWRLFVAPYFRFLTRQYVTQVPSVTTVGSGLSEEYAREFGIRADVVTNASPFHDLAPTPVPEDAPLRLVHSGAAMPDRRLDIMIDAVARVPDLRFDLYLAPNTPSLVKDLRTQAHKLAPERIRVLDPVPYTDLIPTLNNYDVGFYSIPPVSFNQKFSLPNKFFDFVQARLALAIGPSVEMTRIVHEHALGRVASGFDADGLAAMLAELTPQNVRMYKTNSHTVAKELSAESQVAKWAASVDRIAGLS